MLKKLWRWVFCSHEYEIMGWAYLKPLSDAKDFDGNNNITFANFERRRIIECCKHCGKINKRIVERFSDE